LKPAGNFRGIECDLLWGAGDIPEDEVDIAYTDEFTELSLPEKLQVPTGHRARKGALVNWGGKPGRMQNGSVIWK